MSRPCSSYRVVPYVVHAHDWEGVTFGGLFSQWLVGAMGDDTPVYKRKGPFLYTWYIIQKLKYTPAVRSKILSRKLISLLAVCDTPIARVYWTCVPSFNDALINDTGRRLPFGTTVCNCHLAYGSGSLARVTGPAPVRF